MAYSDLPPSLTFWRCAACGYEAKFYASGTDSIECGDCHTVSTMQQLLTTHARAHRDDQSARASAN